MPELSAQQRQTMPSDERDLSARAVDHDQVATQKQSVWDAQLFKGRPPSTGDLEDLLGIYAQMRGLKDPDVEECTWQDVLDKMHEAQQSYQAKGQRNSVRGFFRHGKSIKMVLTPLLEVIPEDYGLRALKGGLTLLFSCLADRADNVEKILRCFEDVPLVMENARETLELFHKNPKLCDHVWDLYHALITGIPNLIKILLGRSDSRWWSHFRSKIPSEQERLISDIVATVDNAKRKLAEYVETVGYQSVVAIEETTTRTAGQVSAIQLDMREMSTGLKLQFWSVMQALQGINKTLIELREENAEQKKQIADFTKQNKYIHVMHTAVYHLGQETFHQRPVGASSVRQIAASNHPAPRYHAAYIQSICGPGIDPQDCLHAAADVKQIISHRYQFDEDSIGRSRWLMTSRRFQQWLTSTGPGALSVHSYSDLPSEGKTSAVSVFCATLASALMQQGDHIVVLSFFCGLHTHPRQKFHGPIGILRSVALQILLMYGLSDGDGAPVNAGGLMRDLEVGIPAAFEHVFRQCASQVPAGTRMFCLIDAADVYDTQRNLWRDGLREAFRLLGLLASDPTPQFSFKLLATTPARSSTILKELAALDSDRFPSIAIDMSTGEFDNRPLTETAIIKDMVGIGTERSTYSL